MIMKQYRLIFFLLLLACQACTQMTRDGVAQAHVPDNFVGLLDYVDAGTVRAWQAQGMSFVILDVRTSDEYLADGHAPDAILQSFYLGPERQSDNGAFLDAVTAGYDKRQKLLVLCASGRRASHAAWQLSQASGFTDVHVFAGGYEGGQAEGYGAGEGWKAAGLPVVFPAEAAARDPAGPQ